MSSTSSSTSPASLTPASGDGAAASANSGSTGQGWSVDGIAEWLLHDGLTIAVVIVLAIVARFLAHRAINRVVASMQQRSTGSGRTGRMLREATGLDEERRRQRAATTGSVLRSAVTLVLAVVTILTVLGQLGVPLAPLLASAGVGGVALGFGAQSLVKDFLSGIFMIVEDQYGVGDVIDTGEVTGTVEEVSLRITRLRDADGVVWYIRNGEIVRVGNRSQGWSTAVVDIPVAYDQPVPRVTAALRLVAMHIREEEPWASRILETPQVAGIESVSGGVMTMRIIAKCAPNENFSVSRELRERSKIALDEAGIRAPAPYPSGSSIPPA
ncbi:mechanosensitive ion channel family protein [Dermacoccaceae bacterium W4C1]